MQWISGSSGSPVWWYQVWCFNGVSQSNTYNTLYATCCDAPIVCQMNLHDSRLVVSGGSGSLSVMYWTAGNTLSMYCGDGYGLPDSLTTYSVSCNPDQQLIYDSPTCVPTPCPDLNYVTVINGYLSATSALTGDVISVDCNQGLVPNGASIYTCLGTSEGWSPSIAYNAVLECVEYSTANQAIRIQWLNQYSYNVSWSPLDWSSVAASNIPAGLIESDLNYALTVTRLFPINGQLSPSNAQEAGLLASPYTYTVNTTWQVVVVDSDSYIEGVDNQLSLVPVVNATGSPYWIGEPTPYTVIGQKHIVFLELSIE